MWKLVRGGGVVAFHEGFHALKNIFLFIEEAFSDNGARLQTEFDHVGLRLLRRASVRVRRREIHRLFRGDAFVAPGAGFGFFDFPGMAAVACGLSSPRPKDVLPHVAEAANAVRDVGFLKIQTVFPNFSCSGFFIA